MVFFKQDYGTSETIDLELTDLNLKKDMQKTRQALEAAYTGFNNATDTELIDSYIYEINALTRRYNHLTSLAQKETATVSPKLRKHTPIRTRITHIFR